MTQCDTVNVKLSNFQLNKLKSGIKKKKYWSNYETFIKCCYRLLMEIIFHIGY